MGMNPLYMNEELELVENTRFQVKDLASLNWTLRKLTAIEGKKRELQSMIDDEIARLKLFLEKETSTLTEAENSFKALISEYAAKKREEDPDFKIKTPYGRVSYRKQADKWLYDEDLLVSYLEQNDYNGLIRTKKEPVKTEIKKLFRPKDGKVYDYNGQLVEGINVEYQEDVLDIKPLEV